MKRISLFVTLLAFIASTSCQKPEDPGSSTVADAPVLVSSSPADGATDISGSSIDLVLTFDRNVICPAASHGMITVDRGAAIEKVNAYMKDVTVTVSGLQRGETYTVTFPEGTITGYSDNPAAGISIRFSTRALAEQEIDRELVTENPIPQARRLYEYLLEIYGKGTLSGAMAHVAWNTDEAGWVGQCTGTYPAVAYFDYIHLASSPANWIDYGDISPVRDWWEDKGLVGASWHWNVPRTEDADDPLEYTCDPDIDFSAAEAVKEGTWENGFVNSSLEKLSGYLKLLQDAGIPVIWRPLHEAAGNTYTQWHSGAWFWWGADGAQAYKDLWIYVFNYLKDAGIRNLIWVWTTQTSSFEDIDMEYYPGDEYVDIIGRDVYDNTDAQNLAAQFTDITQVYTRKMAALSELGGVADMASQWDAGASWLFFMPWYDYDNDFTEGYAHGHADISWWKNSFASDAVISRDELPSCLFE